MPKSSQNALILPYMMRRHVASPYGRWFTHRFSRNISRFQAPNPLAQARRVGGNLPEDARMNCDRCCNLGGFPAGILVRLPCAIYTDSLRCQIAHFEAANYLVSSASRFRDVHKVVASADCGADMRPWREVTTELVGQNHLCRCDAQEAISAIEEKVATNATLASRLDGEAQLGEIFRGMLHSKVCMASFIDASDNLDPDHSIDYAVSAVSQVDAPV